MHFLSSLLLLLTTSTLPCLAQDTSQPPGLEGTDDPHMTKRLVHYWADYACYRLNDQSEPDVKEQCKEACYPDGITSDVPPDDVPQSQTCWLNGPESDYKTGKPLTDEEKKEDPSTSEDRPATWTSYRG